MAREKRRLAAIMAVDVVGYSRLMGRDESGTLARLQEHRKQHLEPALARHAGRLVKLTGDGALVEFSSAVDGVSAAIEFQQAVAEANRERPAGSALVFRMGLHVGDLIVDGDDLYGDGVNIAARLQEQAAAGGILVSRTVKEAVAGRVKATLEDRGRLNLKNIERPIPAFGVTWNPEDWPVSTAVVDVTALDPPVGISSASSPRTAARASSRFLGSKRMAVWAAVASAGCVVLASAGYLAFAFRPTSPVAGHVTQSQSDKPSIAVLAFRNLSGDPEREYFADGMVEGIITTLSRVPDFVVVARNSAYSYKGRSVDVRQVGNELGVRYVVDGSIRIAGNTLRVSCVLIDATSGKHIWAEHYDGAMEDVFDLQDRITSSIVATIQPNVLKAEIALAQAKPTKNLNAYDLYLRALSAIFEPSESSTSEALVLLHRAIAADKNFSAAYGLEASAHWTRMMNGWGSFDEEKARGYEAAKIAVEIGRDDPVALTLGGFGIAHLGRQPKVGLAHIERALTLNPNYLLAWRMGGQASWMIGKHEQSIQYFERAMQLSPRDTRLYEAYMGISLPHFFLGHYDQAIYWSGQALREKPRYFPAVFVRLAALAMEGSHPDEARYIVQQLRSAVPDVSIDWVMRGWSPLTPSDRELFETALRKAGVPG